MRKEEISAFEAILSAERITRESKQFDVSIPMSAVLDLGSIIGGRIMADNMSNGVDSPEQKIIDKLIAVVPMDLYINGRENYCGDLSESTPLTFNACEISLITETALALPSAKDMVNAGSFDATDASRYESDIAEVMKGVLYLNNEFMASGGDIDIRSYNELKIRLRDFEKFSKEI